MSDKLRQGISVLTTFVDGETPTGPKLNSISAQLQYAAQQLEKAVGDIHSQSWPYSAASSTTLSPFYDRSKTTGNVLTGSAERKLDIANLARLVGPASAMNPRQFGGTQVVVDDVPVGVYEFALRFPPKTGATITPSDNGPAGAFYVFVASTTDLTTPGEWTITPYGKVHTVRPTTGGTFTYSTAPNTYSGGMNPTRARHNVIPDPNQISSGGLGIALGAPSADGRRSCTLPLATHAQSNYIRESVVLGDEDPGYNEQIFLPKVLVDNFAVGDLIPEGFLFLKNETTGEVYETAEYYYLAANAFKIGGVDITTEVDRGDLFSCITVGSDLTTAVDDLRMKSHHNHDRTYGEPFIPLNAITGFHRTAGNSGPWVPSGIPSNFAPQYLHRDGWDKTEDTINDQNVMRGHLLLGRTGVDAGYHVGAGASYNAYFGDGFTRIGRNASDELIVHNENAGITIEADGIITLGSSGSGLGVSGDVRIEEQLATTGTNSSSGIIGPVAGIPVHQCSLSLVIADMQSLETLTLTGFTSSHSIYGISVLVNTDSSPTQYSPPGLSSLSVREYDYALKIVAGQWYIDYSPVNMPAGASFMLIQIWYGF